MKKSRKLNAKQRLALIVLAIGVVLCAAILIRRYAPSNDTMELTDYFVRTEADESSVIIDGQYFEPEDGAAPHAIVFSGRTYLEIGFLKSELDDGYFYDNKEEILRYVTPADIISVTPGGESYTVNKESVSLGAAILIPEYETAYVLTDFIEIYTDVECKSVENPARVMVETAGWEKTLGTLKKNTPLRRFGGVKSKVLAEGEKGETVILLDDYGKWSLVLTDGGVLGCVPNRRIKDKTKETVASHIEPREFNHLVLGETVSLGWDGIYHIDANSHVYDILENEPEINVLSPTWFSLTSENGDISTLASGDYVAACHRQGVQVWALFSNVEYGGALTTDVLNTTSSRDNLVNNLIAQAISYNIDGINVDLESLEPAAADGYIEFIRELSLKCEKNDLVLSVDNYVPSAYTAFYNRAEQAKFADYIIVMAYDEHNKASDEAGSVASIGFVENGVKDTLEDVPADQLIVGIPFFTRVWNVSSAGLSSEAVSMGDAAARLSDNGVTPLWDGNLGQYYGEYENADGSQSKIWLEDESSIDLKMKVMADNNLAGAAYWSLSWAIPNSVRNTIVKYVK